MIKYAPKFLTTAFEKVAHGMQVLGNAVKSAYNFGVHHAQKITAALGVQSPMDHKTYHTAKLFGMGAVCLFSAATFNIEGVVGAGFATADEVTYLEKIGDAVLNHQPLPKL